MPNSAPLDPAEAVRDQQRRHAQRLLERLQQIAPGDLTINYTLEKSAVVLPGILVRLLTLALLFRLNSPKKWRLALEAKLLPEPLRRWLGIEELPDLIERATVDWIPPRVFADTLAWQVTACLGMTGSRSARSSAPTAPTCKARPA